MRKEPKGHGTGQWIEGRKTIPDGSRVVVIEDVVTTGGSALKAIERCRVEKLEPVACLALVDRLEGGREAIEAQGVPLETLFTREDFLGMRPAALVRAVLVLALVAGAGCTVRSRTPSPGTRRATGR